MIPIIQNVFVLDKPWFNHIIESWPRSLTTKKIMLDRYKKKCKNHSLNQDERTTID